MKFIIEGEDKAKEDCCPGQPFVTFSTSPGLKIEFMNPTPMSGLFTQEVLVTDGDTVDKVKLRFLKESKAIKGMFSNVLVQRNIFFSLFLSIVFRFEFIEILEIC